MMALKLITPPASEPVSLAEAKAYLRIDTNDEDALISGLITAAREYCESFHNRAYITQTWELSFDDFPNMPLKLPRPPLVSVESVKVIDSTGAETTLDPSDYIVDTDSEPGRIAFTSGKCWPSVELAPINAVKIRYTAGYDDAQKVPQSVKQAMLIYIAHRYENPDTDDVPEVVRTLLWPDRVVPV